VTVGDIVPVSSARSEDTWPRRARNMLREMIRELSQRMMDADVEVRCNAGYGEGHAGAGELPQRLSALEVGPRAEAIELAIPKLRRGRTIRRGAARQQCRTHSHAPYVRSTP
jgi:putative transposase